MKSSFFRQINDFTKELNSRKFSLVQILCEIDFTENLRYRKTLIKTILEINKHNLWNSTNTDYLFCEKISNSYLQQMIKDFQFFEMISIFPGFLFNSISILELVQLILYHRWSTCLHNNWYDWKAYQTWKSCREYEALASKAALVYARVALVLLCCTSRT